MKNLLIIAVAIVAVSLLSTTDASAQVHPYKCEENECCISASCCHSNIGHCSGTCTCTFSCGPKYGLCSCECEEEPEGAPVTLESLRSKLDMKPVCKESTGPISLSARTQVVTRDGPQTLNTIVTGMRKMTHWTVQFPPQFGSRKVEGEWNGTFEKVINEIAWAYRLEALIDEESKTISFVPAT